MTTTSQSEWYTPPRIFTALGLRFDLDPASPIDGGSHVPAVACYTKEDDGLYGAAAAAAVQNCRLGLIVLPQSQKCPPKLFE